MNIRLVRKLGGRLSGVTLTGFDGAWCVNFSHSFFPGRQFELTYTDVSKRHVLTSLFIGFGHKVSFSAARKV